MSHDDHAVRAMSQVSIGSQKEDKNYAASVILICDDTSLFTIIHNGL